MAKLFEWFYMKAEILGGLKEIHYSQKKNRYEIFFFSFLTFLLKKNTYRKYSDLSNFFHVKSLGAKARKGFLNSIPKKHGIIRISSSKKTYISCCKVCKRMANQRIKK